MSVKEPLPTATPIPSPAAGIGLYVIVLLVHVSSILLLNALNLSQNVVPIVTPTLMLLLTVVTAIRLRVDLRETLLLRLPSGTDFIMAFPLAISFFILGDQLSLLTEELFALPEEIAQETRRMMQARTPVEWLLKIGTIGVGAAVSEELMFRGFIQMSFLRAMSRSRAVLWTSFLFMVIHFLPIPAIAAAGIVLGFIAFATRSIVVPIIVHFTNNVAGLLLINLADLDTLGEPLWIPPGILLPALAIFGLTCVYYFRRMDPEPDRPLEPERHADRPRLELPRSSVSLSEELASVPRNKRRLGWLIVAASIVLGVVVLTSLFAASVYSMYPKRIHESVIQGLKLQSEQQLTVTEDDDRARLAAAFDALSALNQDGNLGWRDLFRILRVYVELSADGRLDPSEADALTEAIRDLAVAKTRPRAL